MRTERDIWAVPSQTDWSGDISGYSVEALDGGIGKIDAATNESSGSYLVIDTGPWIFGKKVLLPGGIIDRIDHDSETVFVHRTKDEIKNSPEFDESTYRDEAYRGQIGTYYDEGGPGYRARKDDLR